MAKIMSYMRVTAGKPGKKPKRKDKLAALHGIEHSQGTNFPVVHGTENILPKPAGTVSFTAYWSAVAQQTCLNEWLVVIQHITFTKPDFAPGTSAIHTGFNLPACPAT